MFKIYIDYKNKSNDGVKNYSGATCGGRQPKAKDKILACEGYINGQPFVYCYTHRVIQKLCHTNKTCQRDCDRRKDNTTLLNKMGGTTATSIKISKD